MKTLRFLFSFISLLLAAQAFGQNGTWNKTTGTDPYDWLAAGNWNGSVPNGITSIANMNVDIQNNITVNLTGNINLDQWTLGDSSGTSSYLIQSSGGTFAITFNNTSASEALLRKNGSGTDTVGTQVIINDGLILDVAGGTLILSGGLTMNGNGVQPDAETVTKNGGGTLTVSGNTLLNAGANYLHANGTTNFDGAYNRYLGTATTQGGSTLNFAGGYNYFAHGSGIGSNSLEFRGATTNIGGTTGTTRTAIAGSILQTGGTVNIGRDGGISNTTLYGNLLNKGNGTLRLQFGNAAGTTTVLGGAAVTANAGTLTAGGNTFTASGIAGGSLYAGMRVYGPGIADNTVITAYNSGTGQVTLSNPVAAGFTQSGVPLMFAEGVNSGLTASAPANNSNIISVSSSANFNVGDTITGVGIPKGVRIAEIINGTSVRLETNVTVASGAQLQTYRPGTLTFGSSSLGTAGSTVEFLRGASSQGTAGGQVLFDPSLNLVLEERAFVNITDNAGTIQDFTFNSLNSSSNTTQNTIGSVITTEGSPFIWFSAGQTGLATGSYVTGPGIPPGARIISVNGNTALLDVAATASVTSPGVAMQVTQYGTIRSESGNATLTVGNYGAVNDVFDGRLDFGGSGGNSRVIKVGSNTLTLSGIQDNGGSRVEVQEGTLELAKVSNAYVHAIGSVLIIGDSDAAIETVKLGGSFALPSVKWSNYNDQIFRSAAVTVNSTGFLDLNGFTEGFGVLQDTDSIGGFVGNSNAQAATVIVGEGSDTSGTFRGVIRDGSPTSAGGGMVSFVKSGGGTQTLQGNNTFTGTTAVTRGTVTLSGANGALSGTSAVRVTNSTLFLNNSVAGGGANSNRVNDSAQMILRNGTFTVTNNNDLGTNILENVGAFVSEGGHNIIRIQHDQGVNNRVRINFDSYTWQNGGMVSIVENNGDSTNNRGFSGGYNSNGFVNYLSPDQALSQVTVTNVPTSFLIGGAGATGSADINILMGAFGGHYANQTREFMTVQTVAGVHYIRPLQLSEYTRLTSVQDVNTSNVMTSMNDVARHDFNNARINANLAYNSLRMHGATRTVIRDDKVLKIGDGASAIGYNPEGHVGAGMLNLIDWGTSMYGGYLDFGNREAVIRGQGATIIQSSIVGNHATHGLTKSGGGHLDLWGNNTYSGETYVTQGGIRAFNSNALGLNGVGNEIRLVTSGYDGDTLVLGNGVIVGSQSDSTQRKDVILEFDARLSAFDQNNVLNGDVFVGSGTQGGQNITSYLRTRRNSAMLTINGDIVNDQSETPITATFNGGSGRVLALIGDQMNDGIVTISGSLADKKVGNDTAAATYEYEKLNIMVRGSSGDAGRSSPIMDFHVNVQDATNLTGSLDLRSGFFRLQGDYGTGILSNPTAQGGVINMTMRLRDNDNDFVNQVAVFSMTNNNADPFATPTVYNVNNISWADGNNGYSATSYGILANEGVGKVVIGNGYGSLDMNPTADIAYGGSFSFNYANPPVLPGDPGEPDPPAPPPLPPQNGTVISFGQGGGFDEGSAFSNLAIGMLVEGAGVPAGTFITAIGANSITVSQAVSVTQNTNLSFSSLQSFNLASATSLGGTQTNVITLDGAFSPGFDIDNLRPGMVLTGTGVANSTYILRIDAENNQIVLNKAVTGNPTNIIFNDSIPNSTTTQRYADARLYSVEGGELELRLRLLDDGGFGLENEVGAVTKVGRGDVRLTGAVGLSGELDGGVNLHGGTLILDYSVNSGRKITSGDNHEAPLTLAGGDIHLVGNATVNAVEQLRGLMIMRAGDSQVRVSSAGVSTTTLSLGPPSNLINNITMLPVRYAGSTMSFWRDLAAGGSAVITLEVPDIYTGSVILPWATYVDGDPSSAFYGKVVDFAYVTRANSPSDALGISAAAEEGLFTIGNNLDFVNDSIADPELLYPWKLGYLAEGPEEDFFGSPGSGFYGTIAPEPGATVIDLRAILFNQDNDNQNGDDFIGNGGTRVDPNNVMKIADGSIMTLRTEGFEARGSAGALGGAILISATVGNTHKTIQGGAISSALETFYFDPDITKALVRTNDLIIHNYADAPNFVDQSAGGGIFTLDTNIVDNPYAPGVRLNLVHSGTGWTRMVRATASGPGYGYTGSTFFNGGTLWVSDPNKLGANPGSFDSDNFYFTGGRLRIGDMTQLDGTTLIEAAANNITLNAFRGITIGGDGAFIDIVKASTTFTINNLIAAEVHAPTFAGGIVRKSNLGVGDLTKEGLGTLVITNKLNTYSGRTEVTAGTLQVNIGDPIANQANSNPVAKRAADNEEANLAGTLGSSFSYIDGTFVDAGAQLRFQITGNTTADIVGKKFQNGTGEWITLDGGTLGTTAAHTGGSLQGMIRVRKDSFVDVVGTGVLRFNSEAGMMTSEGATAGQGALTKVGTGTLELWENNTEFKGNWNVNAGRIVGISQGNPFGTGTTMTLGDAVGTAPSATAEAFLSSRQARTVMIEEVAASSTASGNQINVLKGDTTGLYPGMLISINGTNYRIAQVPNATTFNVTGNFPANTVISGPVTVVHTAELPLHYNVVQNLVINQEAVGAAGQQTKKIGARNHEVLANSGMNWDQYNYDGSITLNDDLIVSYYDDVANLGIGHNAVGTTVPLIGRDQVIALNGNIIATNGNDLITEILYNGDVVEQALNKRLRVYFEINGANNSQWNSDLIIGNGAAANADLDKTHHVRLGGTGTPITAATDVIMTSNSIFQIGGMNVTIGNLMVDVAGVAAGTGANTGRQQIIVENSSDKGEGTLRVTQRDNEDWDVQFRNGTTDAHYITNVNNTQAGDGGSGDGTGFRDRRLNLIKDGAATAVLTQDNEYTGSTVVDNGRLQVGRGGSASTRAVGDTGMGGVGQRGTTVNSGGRIGGTGTIQGVANVTTHVVRGVIEPGDYTDGTTSGIGTLAVVGNLDAKGGTFSMQANQASNAAPDATLSIYRDFTILAPSAIQDYNNYVNTTTATWEGLATSTSRRDHDLLAISGSFEVDSSTVFRLNGNAGTFVAGQVFDLVDWTMASIGDLNYSGILEFGSARLYSGGMTGSFDLPQLSEGLLWDLQKLESNGILLITSGYAVIPEPSRALLLCAGLAGLLMRRRRRKVAAGV
ncbi:PEP-CTERM sorting domain-containing protein [Phragmitibacter flavus]|uniref:PEP-CTERM sorting domain-containing protein n=1 Tax=Phragmitibacter flavus TaxID=2576071 RepID=A0A5R8KI14_9BACT|nr:autotransporter-associated beta strand repeat-containing protein [Phragmitibacter flavus]TLD71907.1 PEP-CTERM sorting domain-containing protein [Phragmitibacter flavus]